MRKMKDSGVEWIGQIPKDWELRKIGSVYEERNTKVSDKDYAPLSVTKQGIVPQLESAAKTDNGDNRKLIRKNDFVINSRSDRRGSCGISEYDGSCSLINTVLKSKANMCNKYYSFVFRSELFADEFYRWGNGIVDDLWSTKWSSMKNIYIPFPTIDKQQKIVDFLEEKCSKIDSLIEKQQKSIEKLTEYKLSVITEAVTKGLNYDVELKDSGIRFIGYIPQNWNVSKLKYMSLEIGDGIHGTPEYDSEGEIYFVNGNNIGAEILVFKADTNTINETEFKKYKKPLLNDNTILMTLNGATYGKTSFYSGEQILLGKSAGYITLKPNENEEFVRYYLQSTVAKLIMDYSLCGSTIANVSLRTLNDFTIPYPPKAEQLEIVRYLDKHTSRIDKSINCRQSIVERLIEYKKSLIYEVVTGKKEV